MRKVLMTIGIVAGLMGCVGSQTRAVVATPTQAAAIREILGDQLPECAVGQKAYFVGSQRIDGQLVLAVGCKQGGGR